MCEVCPKYAFKSATGYSLYSVTMPLSIALEQWQLAKTRYRNRQNKGCNGSKETSCMTKEYCTEQGRYGAIIQNLNRIRVILYRVIAA